MNMSFPDPILRGGERTFLSGGREHKLYPARLDPTSEKGEESKVWFYLITDSGTEHLLRFSFFIEQAKEDHPLDYVRMLLDQIAPEKLEETLKLFYEEKPQESTA